MVGTFPKPFFLAADSMALRSKNVAAQVDPAKLQSEI